jgi:hypothetical protein
MSYIRRQHFCCCGVSSCHDPVFQYHNVCMSSGWINWTFLSSPSPKWKCRCVKYRNLERNRVQEHSWEREQTSSRREQFTVLLQLWKNGGFLACPRKWSSLWESKEKWKVLGPRHWASVTQSRSVCHHLCFGVIQARKQIHTCFLSLFLAQQPNGGQYHLVIEVCRSHTQWHTTVVRTPLDEGSARHRDLYLTTHNTYKRQTSMPPAGFEPAIPASEQPQTLALDRPTTGIGKYIHIFIFELGPSISWL